MSWHRAFRAPFFLANHSTPFSHFPVIKDSSFYSLKKGASDVYYLKLEPVPNWLLSIVICNGSVRKWWTILVMVWVEWGNGEQFLWFIYYCISQRIFISISIHAFPKLSKNSHFVLGRSKPGVTPSLLTAVQSFWLLSVVVDRTAVPDATRWKLKKKWLPEWGGEEFFQFLVKPLDRFKMV